tara:strand:- start:392 stop:652 length:261 start_codon:yes stop_codon:yes gene_type:complete
MVKGLEGRHVEAAKTVLATLPNANISLHTSLLGIAQAWDRCESEDYKDYDPRIINGLAVQLFLCLDRLGVEADSDVWETLSQELSR